MASLVLRLQQDALDSTVPVSALLRKALVVARKLNVGEFESWAARELDGYPAGTAVPEYRLLRGEIKAYNPYNGIWMPMLLDNAEEAERLSVRPNNQRVAELESLLANTESKGLLQMPFSKAVEANLVSRSNLPVVPTLIVPRVAIVGILDSDRNITLNWSLQLEKDGIVGQGMSFNDTERRKAADTIYNVTHFYGDVSGSQIQQFSTESSQVLQFGIDTKALLEFVERARAALPELRLSVEIRKEFEADLDTIAAQAKSPKPKNGVVRESLKSLRNVLEGTTGSLIAAGLLSLMPKLLGA